ncbi:MAG: hypothetical protein COB30_016450 [Ectothiorhodospiraceae bacterium]|nr:hypothetical protein [Ectothiorhodospiraceae bacterium]
MAWKFDNPLHTLCTDDQNERAKGVWEGESLGGITEDNNRLPVPIIGILMLTIVTAFLITFPLWGQRPNAAIYEEYIALMDSPAIQGKSDAEAMDYIVSTVKANGSKWAAMQERHPLEMDDLRLIKDGILELKRQKADLREYTVLGNKLVIANFEGNWIIDPNTGKERRERLQPWWDKGYVIDIFFIVFFCIGVIITVKRLPEYTWEPKHFGH